MLTDFVILVRLPANRKLLLVKFAGVKTYTWIFNNRKMWVVGAPDPHVV